MPRRRTTSTAFIIIIIRVQPEAIPSEPPRRRDCGFLDSMYRVLTLLLALAGFAGLSIAKAVRNMSAAHPLTCRMAGVAIVILAAKVLVGLMVRKHATRRRCGAIE